MIIFNQVAAAVLLLSLTLCLAVHRRNYAYRVRWSAFCTRDTHRHGPVYSATLVVKSMIAIVILHGLEILHVGQFLPDALFPVLAARLLLLASSLILLWVMVIDSAVRLATLRATGVAIAGELIVEYRSVFLFGPNLTPEQIQSRATSGDDPLKNSAEHMSF